MAKAVEIILTTEERTKLEAILRSKTAEQRMVFRAKIITMAAKGEANKKIAQELQTTELTVGLWRKRFSNERMAGLSDIQRSGKPNKYTKETERRVLQLLDQPPPEGFSCWNGNLIAETLCDVSNDQVWRILRQHGINLQRRRSWCISTDPEFATKAADIVGLYLSPPENAVVICVDEKPGIQALERAQGWLKLPNGKALTGYSHEYKRHGTTNLFAALETATGLVKTGHYQRKRRIEFLDFMNNICSQYPKDVEIHVVLDNYSTHKVENEKWTAKNPNVIFHFTPTHASWLNQVEVWFSILWRNALRGANFTSPKQICEAIERFTKVYNQDAMPFQWKKANVKPVSPKTNYSDLCN